MAFRYGQKVVDISGAEGIVVDEVVENGTVAVRITKSGTNSAMQPGKRYSVLVKQLKVKK